MQEDGGEHDAAALSVGHTYSPWAPWRPTFLMGVGRSLPWGVGGRPEGWLVAFFFLWPRFLLQ